MRALRILGRAAAIVAGLVVAIVAGIAIFVFAPGGDIRTGRLVSWLASSPGTTVAIGRITVALDEPLRVTDIAVGDATGPWLSIRTVAARLDLPALITGRIDLRTLDIDGVVVDRPPASSGGET